MLWKQNNKKISKGVICKSLCTPNVIDRAEPGPTDGTLQRALLLSENLVCLGTLWTALLAQRCFWSATLPLKLNTLWNLRHEQKHKLNHKDTHCIQHVYTSRHTHTHRRPGYRLAWNMRLKTSVCRDQWHLWGGCRLDLHSFLPLETTKAAGRDEHEYWRQMVLKL